VPLCDVPVDVRPRGTRCGRRAGSRVRSVASTTTLYLVRHAEQAPHAEEADDPGLSSAGRAQAVRVGQRFAGTFFEAVLHSPQRRASETAEVLASGLRNGLVEVSDLLRDVTPVPGAQEEESYPHWLRERLLHVPSDERDVGGQGLARTVRHFGEVYEGESRRLLLVTHAFVVGWLVRAARARRAPVAVGGLAACERKCDGRVVQQRSPRRSCWPSTTWPIYTASRCS
jgi:broad specificity phosphatase PhoE